jgi:hypothetical protein
MAEFTYEIEKHIAKLNEPNAKGWTRELNLISWGGREAKYDIRDWNEDHTKCGKGISLNHDEINFLCQACYDNGIV